VLHNFDWTDGGLPQSGLTLDTTGKVLYGTTPYGGSIGYGVVFSLTIKTRTHTVLHSFGSQSDGAIPSGLLSIGKGGVLYGATTMSDDVLPTGVVFEVVPKTQTETVLYTFTGKADGGEPFGGVVLNLNYAQIEV